jgi:hypothetical protein
MLSFKLLLAFVATVAGHGYVDNVTVNGILYTVSDILTQHLYYHTTS